jgi:hypothetical protein
MKKLVVFYTNCQSQGIVHFLRKTYLEEYCHFVRQNNWQLIMGEQDVDNFLAILQRADAVIYQPTAEHKCTNGFLMPNTETLLEMYVQPKAHRMSFAYQFNDGFFPLVKHGVWKTSPDLIAKMVATRRNPILQDAIYQQYNAGLLTFDCARRFAECLAEQNRREEVEDVDIQMAPFILQRFQRDQLFISENHPASALYEELACQIGNDLRFFFQLQDDFPEIGSIPYSSPNECNMPGEMPVHEAVVKELGLRYPATEKAHEYYRTKLDELFRDCVGAGQT